jgi:hypothetical protein
LENRDFVGGLTLDGFVAPTLLDGPMDAVWFLAWIIELFALFFRTCQIEIPHP